MKKKGFTLTEILIALTVIGIAAALAVPSLIGEFNERSWNTKRQALYARFSQAIPLMDKIAGYGTLNGTIDSNNNQTISVDTAAETFIAEGLSKVIKINNSCANDNLTDCNFPENIYALDGTTKISLNNIKTLGDYNNHFLNASAYINSQTTKHQQLNTKAAAFETVNGESILVYYNPNCTADYKENRTFFTQSKMCANFIYDLNGVKAPNMFGKDIGFITAIYATEPSVVAPMPLDKDAGSGTKQTEGAELCKAQEEGARLPSIDELMAMFYNMKLLGITSGGFWSSSIITIGDSGTAWAEVFGYGTRNPDAKTITNKIRCVKK